MFAFVAREQGNGHSTGVASHIRSGGGGTGTSRNGNDPRTFGGHKLRCQSSNSSCCTRLSLCPEIYIYIYTIYSYCFFAVVVVFVFLLLLFFHLIYYQLCWGSFCWHNLTRPTICCRWHLSQFFCLSAAKLIFIQFEKFPFSHFPIFIWLIQ